MSTVHVEWQRKRASRRVASDEQHIQFDFEKKELHPKTLKELKNVVRRNEGIIPELVDVLFGHLGREDSDLRLCVVLVVDYFFQRSHRFRIELVDHLQVHHLSHKGS